MIFYILLGIYIAWLVYNYIIYQLADLPKKFGGGKVVVIVGASSGIGEELAYQLSQYKPKLVLAARRLEKLQDIKKKCESIGATVLTVQADVSLQADCKKIVDTTLEHYQKLDILFLNAGVAMTTSLFKMKDPEPLKTVFETDLLGAVYTSFYALPALRVSKGHIVVTSSAYGKIPDLGISAYSASKHGLHGFFDCLRGEETRNNIHVTLVCPGYIKTPIHDRSLGSDGKEVGSHKKRTLLALTETSLRPAVHNILQATASNQSEIYFPFLVNFAVHLRGIIGSKLFDRLLLGSK